MIFKIEPVMDDLIQSAYDEGMRELNDFWGIGWKDNTPDIFVLESRDQIDNIKETKTSRDLVGWSKNRDIFVLDFKNIETESNYHLTKDQYKALIKHELNHQFHGIVSGGAMGPLWFREGLSICLSGQITLGQWQKPSEFKGFIENTAKNRRFAYSEGGFVVELLVQKFGKEKIIEMVKYLRDSKPSTTFKEDFESVFGFELTYKEINKLYLES